VKNRGASVICLPTTSGTSAEITDVAVLSEPEKKVKIGLRSPQVAPAVAILDPALTLTLPPAPTRESGLDALAHAIESFICLNAWTPTEALTLKGIELIGRHLRRATHDGSQYEARDGMMMGSLLAGMGLHTTWVNLVHAITDPWAGFTTCPTGGQCHRSAPCHEVFASGSRPQIRGNRKGAWGKDRTSPERRAAEKAVEAVEQLSRDTGMPQGLSVYGVKEAICRSCLRRSAPASFSPLPARPNPKGYS